MLLPKFMITEWKARDHWRWKRILFFLNWIPSKCHRPVWILVNIMVFEKYLFEFSSSVRLLGKTTSRNWSVVAYKIQLLLFCLKYFFFFSTESKTEIAHYYWPKWPGRKFLPLFFQRGGAHSSGPRELKALLDSGGSSLPIPRLCLKMSKRGQSPKLHVSSLKFSTLRKAQVRESQGTQMLVAMRIFSLSPED